MGGHGGLNILPQKRWNVYNYENREKVRKDEEAAAREEQLQREQARKRDAEFRLERLRASRGLAPLTQAPEPVKETSEEPVTETDESGSKSNHINLFEGIKIFDPVKLDEKEGKGRSTEKDGFKRKKMRKEEVASSAKVVMPEDEKYRLGYGVAGKGVKLPWYLEKRTNHDENHESNEDDESTKVREEGKNGGKKTLQELREERLKREKMEKERERALIMEKSRRDRSFSKSSEFTRR